MKNWRTRRTWWQTWSELGEKFKSLQNLMTNLKWTSSKIKEPIKLDNELEVDFTKNWRACRTWCQAWSELDDKFEMILIRNLKKKLVLKLEELDDKLETNLKTERKLKKSLKNLKRTWWQTWYELDKELEDKLCKNSFRRKIQALDTWNKILFL